jgi:cobalt-zinc-cadmium efflux system membrane fusion protein
MTGNYLRGAGRTKGYRTTALALTLSAICLTFLAACDKSNDPAAEAPPPATVEHKDGFNLIRVDRAERFPLFKAVLYKAVRTLSVTGTVYPDISREIPIISLANGRVVAIHARLGDSVRKGQLMMEVQSSDISGAFDQYLKAMNDERLARVQLERAKILYEKGAIAQSQLEIAETSQQDANADLAASEQQLRVLGVDKDNPSASVKIYSPSSGVIIAQNVTNAAAAGVGLAGSPNAFTIADLSHVWIICDVYENDLPDVHLGQTADIRLNAYPKVALTGTISDIGAVLDPSIRTAKVRIQVDNPQRILRLGMFATATFYGRAQNEVAAVPSAAVLHLHDREWVYVPAEGDRGFVRVEVRAGNMLPGSLQEITSGIKAGQQVVSNALELQNTTEQ